MFLFMEEDDHVNNSKQSTMIALFIMETLSFFEKIISQFSSISSDPLFSTIITLLALTLLYFPYYFLQIALSPIIILTSILLLSLLRLSAIQRFETQKKDAGFKENSQKTEQVNPPASTPSTEEDHKWVGSKLEFGSEHEVGFYPDQCFEENFVEWNVRAPLEIIYEEFEGEEREDPNTEPEELARTRIERYPSLSLYYPESDSDSSSDGEFPVNGEWFSPGNMGFFKLNGEEREELIEIALDGNKKGREFHVEEENLIEIDIFPAAGVSEKFSDGI